MTDPLLRFATLEDVDAVVALHASRISEGFLVSLGPAFLRRLYSRVVRSHGSFLLVADEGRAGLWLHRGRREHEGAVSRVRAARRGDGHDHRRAGSRGPPGLCRRPCATDCATATASAANAVAAEILSTCVAADHTGRGIGTQLVRVAVDELERRGVESARVVTAVGNLAAVHAYERGGFRSRGREEVHRGVTQELLVWP